ncbi:hypothetical protein CLIB1444_02S02740 [[Candida] jaroonii]|uniref:Uncharacterized protein n=1 Tax=[Candida] jaroonii TaxID=467808 RepID=A0ACA9Y2I7_9ASCO|nr:hypothetical protein CLIB1444_02S02740 [[Candida] jaroonii]
MTTAVSPSTPKHNKSDLYHWSKDEIVQRVLELEEELVDFQGYSKELEEALEEELKQLELDNKKLTSVKKENEATIKIQSTKIKELTRQLRDQEETYNEDKLKNEAEVRSLKQKLVDIEIINDNMESNDRVISQKLELSNQFNNELIEKIALLENDLYMERKANNEKDLFISNYQNTINDLKQQVDENTNTDINTSIGEVDVSVLSMKDVLRAGPPISPFSKDIKDNKKGMVKSDSLQKLHELSVKTEGLSNRIKSLRRDSLYLASPNIKSPSTTQLSNHLHTSNSRKENFIEKSKTSKNLTSMLIKESQKSEKKPLSTINGSPNVSKIEDKLHGKEKKRKRKDLFGNFKSLALGHS